VREGTEGPLTTVQYLIFELAEGDVRSKLDEFDAMGLAWALRSMHHVATGLRQLHSIGVAHQDLKPSNVLLFDEGSSSKIGDLGRSVLRNVPAPHEEAIVAGAIAYAPPELLYKSPPEDWPARRFGCDTYLLGSMVVFLLTGLSATALLMKHLPEELHYRTWAGTYEDILPHLQQAFADMLSYLEPNVPEPVREVLMSTLAELCEPDPANRGDAKNRSSRDRYSLHRYVTRFDLAARRAEIRVKSQAN
jgi:serine/threonine protein kinase